MIIAAVTLVAALGYEDVAEFLKVRGCVANPEILYVTRAEENRPGYFRDGVVQMASKDKQVLVHELWHACQYAKRGECETSVCWLEREAEARRIQKQWLERDQ